jgi:hypothetical protein
LLGSALIEALICEKLLPAGRWRSGISHFFPANLLIFMLPQAAAHHQI